MRHIFISYSHDNKQYRNELVKFLEDNSYSQETDIWFDDHITLATDWRDEIEEAIVDAFCMIFIATKQSIESEFCTYEWSYALGYGVPVITIIWNDDSQKIKLHQPLARNQFLQLNNLNQDLLIYLNSVKGATVEQHVINEKLASSIYPFRVMARLSSWMGNSQQLVDNYDRELFHDVLEYALQTTLKVKNDGFVDLFLLYQTSMSKRQCRYAREIIEVAMEFWHKFHSPVLIGLGMYTSIIPNDFSEVENFRLEKIETALVKLSNDEASPSDEFYRLFDKALISIEQQTPLKQRSILFLPLQIFDRVIVDSELRKRVKDCISTLYRQHNGDFPSR